MVEAGIGGKTVDELNKTMTVSEFLRWQAYDQMFPIGFNDLHFGRLMHLLANIYSKKGHEPKLRDFLMGELPENDPTTDDLEKKIDKLVAMTGGESDGKN